ncbi:MAG: biopolymer transporter ExbD [Myxococcota bacterium]
MSTGAPDEPIVGINVTPLVDVMLVLLVVFIVTARLIVADALPLDLPRAAQGDEQQTVLSIELGSGGETVVNRRPVGKEADVGPLAVAALASAPELRAVIKADGAVPHRRVVAVMDALRAAKVDRIAFGVKRPGEK